VTIKFQREITDDGYNICFDGSANFISGSSYNYIDPQLDQLADNGGSTLTMALLSYSPAIDFGDSAGIQNTDQCSYLRPFGDGPDIGAFEFGSYQPFKLHLAMTATDGQLSCTTPFSGSYRFQASTNLKTWTDLITNGPFAAATNLSQAFTQQGFNARYFHLVAQ